MAFFAEKSYNSADDRLFLSYYALPHSLKNKNGWSVAEETMEENIKSFIGKPVVLKRKDPNNPLEAKESGSFVHPTVPHTASLRERLEYQENFAVGRILDVKLNPKKGFRFDVEITDPKAKEVLKSEEYIENYPPYVSPLILSFGHQYPEEERNQHYKHWEGVHLAFVDKPAYGFEHASVAGRCLGKEEECQIKLHSASEQDTVCNFCVYDAMKEIITGVKTEVNSSDISQKENQIIETKMASTNTAAATPSITNTTGGVTSTYTTNPQTGNKDFTVNIPDSQTNANLSNKPEVAEKSQQEKTQVEQEKPKQEENNLPKTYDEAITQLKSLQSVISELTANQAKTTKFIADLQHRERIATLKTLVPREIFKSDDKYLEELERVSKWQGLSDEEIKEHFSIKSMQQVIAKEKGASLQNKRELLSVPEYQQASESKEGEKNNKLSSSNTLRMYKFVKKIGGVDLD